MKTHPGRIIAIVAIVASPAVCRGGLLFPFAPIVTEQPASHTIYEGDLVQFSVRVEAFPVATTFQWRKNGVNVSTSAFSAGTFSMLAWSPARPGDAGSYDVVVANSEGKVTSAAATLTVLPPNATITTQPVGGVVTAGERVFLWIGVAGPQRTSLQWKKDGVAIAGATQSSITFNSVTTADSASYSVLVTAPGNSIESQPANVTVMPRLGITQQPVSCAVAPGGAATFRVEAVGTGLSYQWRKNTVPIAGATGATLVVPSVTTSDMGFYSVVVSVEGRATESAVAVLTILSSSRSRLANISTRGFVSAGGALTPGFVVRGSGTKQLVVRAAGPALTGFGIAGALTDPRLELLGRGAALVANDDWGTNANMAALTASSAAVGAFPLGAGSRDSAMLATIDTEGTGSSYSARVTAASPSESGLVLAEIYDAQPSSAPVQIINVSTLAHAGSGTNALVAGFVVEGAAPKKLLIRAVGPGLAAFGVAGTLADPELHLFSQGQLVASNDDWRGDAEIAAAFAGAGAFTLARDSKDAALALTLPPGNYTAEVTGVGGLAGLALVEIYDLDP